jgi:hypothetical protein
VDDFVAPASCPMSLTFQKGKTIRGKTIQKQRQKNEGQKNGDWISSQNAHSGAKRNRKYFSALHFSVMTFLKS